jgi:hypothetical protein
VDALQVFPRRFAGRFNIISADQMPCEQPRQYMVGSARFNTQTLLSAGNRNLKGRVMPQTQRPSGASEASEAVAKAG